MGLLLHCQLLCFHCCNHPHREFASISHEDYKDVVKLCRENIRRAKAQLELNLATAVKDNKKCFYKFINSKRRIRENLPPLLDAEGTW